MSSFVWEPVEDEYEFNEYVFYVDDKDGRRIIEQAILGDAPDAFEQYEVCTFPDDLRLCRRVPVAAPVPAEVREAIRTICDDLMAYAYDDKLHHMPLDVYASYDAVRAWLDQEEQG